MQPDGAMSARDGKRMALVEVITMGDNYASRFCYYLDMISSSSLF